MKHFIILLLACTLFPLTIQAQIRTVMSMHHDDDTVDVEYTKDIIEENETKDYLDINIVSAV